MQHGARGSVAVLAGLLASCQAPVPDTAPRATTTVTATTAHGRSSTSPITPIDWGGAGDCLDQLRLVHTAARSGRLEQAHAPPFAIVPVTPTTSLDWVSAPAVPLVADLPLDSYEDPAAAAAAAPCLLLVERPSDLRAAHRVVDFQNVASLYQTGVRTERNPDYDAAQTSLKEAERERKRRGHSILQVGDPMLDLIGMLVGGVIATFDQFGSDSDLDKKLTALKETPRSRDRPVYEAYEFERSTVRAGKEATIPIALRDVKRDRIWRGQLRQRELRQFSVVEGLDARDRDYEQHRAGAFSWEEFDHWEGEPPQLPYSALIAALVDAGANDGVPQMSGPELVADAMPSTGPTGASDAQGAALPLLTAIEPEGGPDPRLAAEGPSAAPALPWPDPGQSGPNGARAEPSVFAAALDPRTASLVRLETDSHKGSGFYVRPRLVATTADLVGTASMVDVTTSDGEKVLGLVVHTDPARNLAVMHVPRSGRPAALSQRPALAPGQAVDVLELLGHDRVRMTIATLQPAAAGSRSGAARVELDLAGAPATLGAPVFVNERAVGLIADQGGDSRRGIMPIDDLAAILASEPLAALR
jgi:Trypsin-like peptidase domain